MNAQDRAPLTGAAVGDALGMPFETLPPTARALTEWRGHYVDPKPPVAHLYKAGQFTDDTQMSMALAEALVEKSGGFHPNDVAAKYLAWYQSGDARGVGGSVRKAMERLAAGATWDKSGEPGSFGDGSAMRAGVIGAFHHRGAARLEVARDWARVDASITHEAPEPREGSAAMAVAVSHLVAGGSRETLLDVVLGNIQKSRVYFALEDLKRISEAWDGEHKTKSGRHLRIDVWLLESNLLECGPSSKVFEAVPAAFAALLSAETFAEAVEGAIRAGGDTDTVGSMAGALAGAHWGFEAIPQELISGLERHDEIRALELKLLA